MPDSFFATNSRKRKRSASSKSNRPSNKKPAITNGKTKALASTSGPSRIKKRIADEELSDATEDDGIDDLDLRVSDDDAYKSASENEDETPAEKRLRLAQLYLDGVRTSLGMYSPSKYTFMR
jgi:ribosomal RNA-processing protein 9